MCAKIRVKNLILIASMVLILTACGDKNKNSQDFDDQNYENQNQTETVDNTIVDDSTNEVIDKDNNIGIEDNQEQLEENTVDNSSKYDSDSNVIKMSVHQPNDYTLINEDNMLFESDEFSVQYNGTDSLYKGHTRIKLKFNNKTNSTMNISACDIGYLNGIGLKFKGNVDLPAKSTTIAAFYFESYQPNIFSEDNMIAFKVWLNITGVELESQEITNEISSIKDNKLELKFRISDEVSTYEIPVTHINKNGLAMFDAVSMYDNKDEHSIGVIGFVFNNTNDIMNITLDKAIVNGVEVPILNNINTSIEPFSYCCFDVGFDKDILGENGLGNPSMISIKPTYLNSNGEYEHLGTWVINYTNEYSAEDDIDTNTTNNDSNIENNNEKSSN